MTETGIHNSNPTEVNSAAAIDSEAMLRWRKHNVYYYMWLEKIYKFVVRPNSKVLHVGCECGDLLAAVQPAYGVGVDTDPACIELAKKRFPHLKFHTAELNELNPNE